MCLRSENANSLTISLLNDENTNEMNILTNVEQSGNSCDMPPKYEEVIKESPPNYAEAVISNKVQIV